MKPDEHLRWSSKTKDFLLTICFINNLFRIQTKKALQANSVSLVKISVYPPSG